MAEGVWDGKMVPRSGSESSLSGTAVESALDLEAVGEDAKICNGHMITLVHIFSQPGFNTISILLLYRFRQKFGEERSPT